MEAARAGEAGTGFAVVADEVRNLARRSAAAAKDTALLIEESIASSQEGSEKLRRVSEAIQGITDGTGRVRSLIEEVARGNDRQARGVEQIAQAMAEMEKATQRSAAGAEETASAGREMYREADKLAGVVKDMSALIVAGR